MTDLWEKAQQNGADNVSLVADLESRPVARLRAFELVEADEISDEGDFPKHGQFLAVEEKTASGKYDREAFWECPAGLARMVVEAVEESGGPAEVKPATVTIDVDGAAKTEGGAWRFWASIDV